MNEEKSRTYIVKERPLLLGADEGRSFYKLGKLTRAEKIRTRYKNLQVGNPRILEVIKVYAGNRETDLHRIYDPWRYRGEWFLFPEGMVFPNWQEAPYSLELEKVDRNKIRQWHHPDHGFVLASIRGTYKVDKKLSKHATEMVRRELNTSNGWRLISE